MERKISGIQKTIFSLLVLIFVALAVTKFSSITVLAQKGDQDDPFTTEAELADYLKTQLVNRVETFTPVYYASTEQYFAPSGSDEETKEAYDAKWSAFISDIFDQALAHPGVGSENAWKQGDYIRHNLGLHGGGYSVRYNLAEANPTYNYGITFSVEYLASAATYTAAIGDPGNKTAASMEAQVETELDKRVNDLALVGKTDYEKVMAIHNNILKNVTYATNHMGPEAANDIYHSTYASTLIREGDFPGTSVCQGYATMFYYMAMKAGLDCRVVTGLGNGTGTWGAHAWNIVKIDGQWYDIDVTWDSNLYNPSMITQNQYKYFLRLESEFSQDHQRADEYNTAEFTSNYPMAVEGNQSTQVLGCNVLIGTYIAMKWYVAVPTNVTGDLTTIDFSFPGDPNGDIYKQTGTLADDTSPTRMPEKNVYQFTCYVPAYKMCDEVQAKLTIGSTEYATYNTSLKSYADALLKNPQWGQDGTATSYNANVLNALLYYGKYSQAYFNSSATGNPAEYVTAADPVPGVTVSTDDAVDSTITGTQEGISYYGTSLILRDRLVIRHYFKLDDPTELSKYTKAWSGQTADSNWNTVDNNNALIYVETDPWNYNQLNAYKTINVYRDGTNVLSFKYNAYNYMKVVFEKEADNPGSVPTGLLNLLKALYNYSKAV